MKKLALTIGTLAALAVAGQALAGGPAYASQSNQQNNALYVGVHGGVAMPGGTLNSVNPSNLGAGLTTAKTGFDVGAAAGYRMGHFRAEGAVDYLRNSGKSNNPDVNTVTVMGNGYFDFMPAAVITPYVMGGVGWMHNSFNKGVDSENHFAYQFGAGLAYHVTDSIVVNGGYRYLTASDNSGMHYNIVEAGVNYLF